MTLKEIVEFKMCVKVFGNSPSPAVATYGLRRTAEIAEKHFSYDVCKLVEKNDALPRSSLQRKL